MHITALCPFCRSSYQVQETLRGQLMRCPNTTCRKIFPVPAEEAGSDATAASKPPPSNGPRSGSVGDLVPMLPTEQAAPPPESGATSKHVSEILPVSPVTSASESQPKEGEWWNAAPPVRTQAAPAKEKPGPASRPPAAATSGPPASDTAWWHNAPPVSHPPAKTGETPIQSPAAQAQRVRTPARPAAETRPMPVVEPEKSDQPLELPPGQWEPPPVRRGETSQEQAAQPVDETAATPSQTELGAESGPPLSKRRAWSVIAGSFLLFSFLFCGALVWAWQKYHHSEEARAKKALEYYGQHSFIPAEEEYKALAKDFSTSAHAGEYDFRAEWCGVCSTVSNPDADLPAAAGQFERFVEKRKDDRLMHEVAGDAGKRLLDMTKALASRSANPSGEQPLKVVQSIEQLRRSLIAIHRDALTKEDSGQIDADLDKVRKAVDLASRRRDVLAQVKLQDKETPIEAIKRVHNLLLQNERDLPGITAEAQGALAQLERAHFASVVYYPAKDNLPKPPARSEEEGQTLSFAPLVSKDLVDNAPANSIRLALVRGVLYALNEYTGERIWEQRVGIDTTALPVHVPASGISNPELLLVLSADAKTLRALNIEGKREWEYYVGHTVLGRPIIIERRAYLADYGGWVHEIELAQGKLIGRWFLGQRLTCGGAREGETSRIYFPADDVCTYVLDVNPNSPRCVTILYDDHPSGSLRSEPVIVPPEGEGAPGYLILNQASSLDAMQLRVFELPLQDRHAAALTLKPPARLDGWTWFEPRQDGEKMTILSDAGRLGVFGIRQQGNLDPALFPWLQPRGLDLSPFLRRPETPAGKAPPKKPELLRERGRAQVVHMQGNDLWLLAHGHFQQVNLGIKWQTGPQAAPVWKEPLALGSPLHQSQRSEDPNGVSTFYLVTQAHQQQSCLATAVSETGSLLWQRQLGLVCQGEPLPLTPPAGGPPLFLALDHSGALFVLDPQLSLKELRSIRRLLAPGLPENPSVPPRLLPAADGHSAYEIAAPGGGETLIVRHIEWVRERRELICHERKMSLLDATGDLTPAGPAALMGSYLLIPMSDGWIRALPLHNGDAGRRVLSWRKEGTPVLAPCYVLALSNDRFLTTDGNRSLSVYQWSPEKSWQRLPKGRGAGLKPLDSPVAAPPVLLPSAGGQPARLIVGDSEGVLHLFVVEPDGTLQADRTWNPKGNLTSGPFVQAGPKGAWHIGCVVDHSRLFWIDPDKGDPLWNYDSKGSAILGQPQQIGDMLVLALQSGRYVGLDPNTGKGKGDGYSLRASAAPAATPIAFGPGRMFAPLSDGTALLLPVELLRRR